jgi:K+-sensing histidine kinase KdpD
MEEDQLDALFSALHHVRHNDDSPEPSSSIGLGLATTARIVEKLDGQLRVSFSSQPLLLRPKADLLAL